MDNSDYLVQLRREQADDRYFDSLGERYESDYDNMTMCEKCAAGYDVWDIECDNFECPKFPDDPKPED